MKTAANKKHYFLLPCLILGAISPASGATLSGDVTLVSDYRFRGVSLSDGKIVPQAGLNVSLENGLYAGTWASRIAPTAGGARTEIDLYAGYSHELGGGLALDGFVTWYGYPGDSGANYFETLGEFSWSKEETGLTMGLAFAPKQDALRDENDVRATNFYSWLGIDQGIGDAFPLPIIFSARIGRENGVFDYVDNGAKWDWRIGLDIEPMPHIKLSAHYVDSTANVMSGQRNLAGSSVIFGLSAFF